MTGRSAALRIVQCIRRIGWFTVMVSTDLKAMVLDLRQVAAALHATGSSDPDVLFARKEELLALSRKMHVTAALTIVWGLVISLTLIGAVNGISAVRRGIALRKCAAGNVKTIEAAYST